VGEDELGQFQDVESFGGADEGLGGGSGCLGAVGWGGGGVGAGAEVVGEEVVDVWDDGLVGLCFALGDEAVPG